MSDLDIRALEANFAGWSAERAPDLPPSKAFERYSIEQILKDADLGDDDIKSGDLGGGDDGGVDAMYLFMNTLLITEEADPPDPTTTVELVLIQAKRENAFKENAVEKLHTFARDLLDYSKSIDKFTYLNSDAKDAITNFRTKYDKVLGTAQSTRITFHYACMSVLSPHPKVSTRVEALKGFITSRISNAEVTFEFWGSTRLLNAARATPTEREVIPINGVLQTPDGSVICLVQLKSFADFLTDDRGNLKTRMLEPNVRDYQGKRNPVNVQIRETLNRIESKEEFWWLNNGVTILAKECSLSGNKLAITKPEVVNGLQTSHEIFGVLSKIPNSKDSRSVLVRVIIPTDERSRNEIIKATNSQTTVDTLSLRATDRIHLDIEDRLKLYKLFYDRRKGEYRRLRKPISQIISIRELAQSCIAIVLQQPDDARARPQTVLKTDHSYKKLFDEDNNRDLYAACILIDRQVDNYLQSSPLTTDEKRDIRYYMDMVLSCELTKNAKPSANDIAAISQTCVSPFDPEILHHACNDVLDRYKLLGGNDKVAKGPKLREAITTLMETRFSSRT